jgi:peptide deformylase
MRGEVLTMNNEIEALPLTPRVLLDVAEPVPHGADVVELLAGMAARMRQAGGIGLAAPQVGISQRIIIVSVEGFRHALINPVIVKRFGGIVKSREGCLSFPGRVVTKWRDRNIRIEAYDPEWNLLKLRVRGLASRCVQHEIDHLDGITIIT